MLTVINEVTRKRASSYNLIRGVVYKDDNYIELGWFKPTAKQYMYELNGNYYPILNAQNVELVFSKRDGKYIVKSPSTECYRSVNIYGNGKFPYKIEREYEAEKHIDYFKKTIKNKQEVEEFEFAKYLKYSFGLEFETAAGYVPEGDCFDLGLIPLRDGSISGVEYSTIPLEGNEGFNKLKEQLKVLKENTVFNKNCSTHIHLGGFPVNRKSIFALHTLWYNFQYYIDTYIPDWSYSTNNFKGNGKNYCNPIPEIRSFEELYECYVGQKYLGDLYQPHPNDIEKRAKWNIKTRYFNCNLINILCYNCAKTIEFRFLTPTYSFEKLTTFLLFFNALLQKAEEIGKMEMTDKEMYKYIMDSCYDGKITIETLLDYYPNPINNKLKINFEKLYCLKRTQNNVGDYCGSRVDIEYKYFPDGQ